MLDVLADLWLPHNKTITLPDIRISWVGNQAIGNRKNEKATKLQDKDKYNG